MFLAALSICLVTTATVAAGNKLTPLGQDVTIWFDTGGPVGGPYNTIVQNGGILRKLSRISKNQCLHLQTGLF
jgi:hypothetical protein